MLWSPASDGATVLSNACAEIREKWEPETTLRNLRMIREAHERRGETVSRAKEIEAELARKAEE